MKRESVDYEDSKQHCLHLWILLRHRSLTRRITRPTDLASNEAQYQLV